MGRYFLGKRTETGATRPTILENVALDRRECTVAHMAFVCLFIASAHAGKRSSP